jgi:uncharacterized protein (DUF1697 family)
VGQSTAGVVKTYIVLLRGINVGGSHRLPMKDLKRLLEQSGRVRAERLLGVEATARNRRTVTTLLDMASASVSAASRRSSGPRSRRGGPLSRIR